MKICKQIIYNLLHTAYEKIRNKEKNNEAQLENKNLTKDFFKRYFELENSKMQSLKILINFHIVSQKALSGRLITKVEAASRAAETFNKLKEVNLVDENNLIVPELKKLYLKLNC